MYNVTHTRTYQCTMLHIQEHTNVQCYIVLHTQEHTDVQYYIVLHTGTYHIVGNFRKVKFLKTTVHEQFGNNFWKL